MSGLSPYSSVISYEPAEPHKYCQNISLTAQNLRLIMVEMIWIWKYTGMSRGGKTAKQREIFWTSERQESA